MSRAFSQSYSSSGTNGTTSVSCVSTSGRGSCVTTSSSSTSGDGSFTRNVIGGNNIITTREDNDAIYIQIQGPQISLNNTDLDVYNGRVRIQGFEERSQSPNPTFVHQVGLPPNAIVGSKEIWEQDGLINVTVWKQRD
eukprot:TRINITY_DN3070_c0_g1_i3.p1 TRINITY_DN3070_c0_g1~~TRINITY_DN3070_c0_g1_i3.p1  ORF type:complete len:138 (-),score=14.15 TRINITY_DN3070_c0_g1_i3:156-569(-)